MEKKVALVVGGSRGIGKAIAIELMHCGYKVIITYKEHLEDALKIQKSEDDLLLKCDITNEEDIMNMISRIKDTYGHIDLLINSVGIALDNKIEDKTKEEFIKVLDTNLIGPFLVVKHALPLMEKAIVIHIASTDGIDTYNEYNIDYSVSKAGLIHLTKALAYALPKIKFYAIAPNFVNTDPVKEMNPIFLNEELKRVGQKRLLEPKEIADEVIKLLDSKKESGSLIVLRGDK